MEVTGVGKLGAESERWSFSQTEAGMGRVEPAEAKKLLLYPRVMLSHCYTREEKI